MNSKIKNSLVKTEMNPDGILRLTLNNPNNHNVLSEEMMENIQAV